MLSRAGYESNVTDSKGEMYPTDGYGGQVVMQEPLRDNDLNGETARLIPAFDYSSDE